MRTIAVVSHSSLRFVAQTLTAFGNLTPIDATSVLIKKIGVSNLRLDSFGLWAQIFRSCILDLELFTISVYSLPSIQKDPGSTVELNVIL